MIPLKLTSIDRRSPFFVSMLTNGNYFFTAIFAVESFVKLAAMSPRFFFAVSENISNMTPHPLSRVAA